MKKFSVILGVLLVLSLSACDNSDSKSDVISASELNDREDTIVSTMSEQSFVFDYNIDTGYKEVTVWIEKYESGELVNDKLGYMTTEIDENNGTIILATPRRNAKEKQQTYYVGVGHEGGVTGSATASDEKPEDTENQSIVSGQLTDEKTLHEDQENVLATIAYSNDDFGTSSISNSFYEDPEAHKDELNNYNVVYLFKAAFKK